MKNQGQKRLTQAWRRELDPGLIELLEKPVIIQLVEDFGGRLIDASIRPKTQSERESRTNTSTRRRHAD